MPSTDVFSVVNSHNGRKHGPVSEGDSGTDLASFTIAPGHVFSGYSLVVEDGKYNRGARVVDVPSFGASGSLSMSVRWYFDGGPGQAFIRYRVSAAQLPLAEMVPDRWVRGFRPTTGGLHFVNSWAEVRLTFNVGPVPVSFKGANGGACGGMAFLVRDLFEAGFLIPADTGSEGPDSGPVYDQVMARLRDSFNLPGGPKRYLELMNPGLRDQSQAFPPHKGRSEFLREAWKQIRADIDAQRLSAIGLVLVRSRNPKQLANNHQVLAWGYSGNSDDEGVIFLYDPNFPDDDRVTIAFRIDADGRVGHLQSPYASLVGFFRNDYAFKAPQRPALGSTVRVAFDVPSLGRSVVAVGGVLRMRVPGASNLAARSFTVERSGAAGPLRSGELVNLKAHDNRYVVAENRGGGAVNANRGTALQWERWVVEGVGSAFGTPLADGDEVTLRSDDEFYWRAHATTLDASGSRTGPAPTAFTLRLL